MLEFEHKKKIIFYLHTITDLIFFHLEMDNRSVRPIGVKYTPPKNSTHTPPINVSYAPPKRTWMNRYPRLFVSVTTTTLLLILFSRPIYDAFIRSDLPPGSPPPPRVPMSPPKLSELYK